MGGDGILSNMKVVAIVGISSCYAGIFKGTNFLHGIKEFRKSLHKFRLRFIFRNHTINHANLHRIPIDIP